MCVPEDPQVSVLRAEVEVWKEREKTARLRNAVLKDALARCVKAMGTLEAGVPVQVAMADQKFREFYFAAKDAKTMLESMGHGTQGKDSTNG